MRVSYCDEPFEDYLDSIFSLTSCYEFSSSPTIRRYTCDVHSFTGLLVGASMWSSGIVLKIMIPIPL